MHLSINPLEVNRYHKCSFPLLSKFSETTDILRFVIVILDGVNSLKDYDFNGVFEQCKGNQAEQKVSSLHL